MKLRIGGKLFISYIIIILLTLVAVGSLLNPFLKGYLISTKQNELVQKATEIGRLTTNYYNKEYDQATFQNMLDTLDSFIDSRIMVIDKEGMLVMASQPTPGVRSGVMGRGEMMRPGKRFNDADIQQVLAGQTVVREGVNTHFNEPMLSVAVPITIKNSDGDTIIGAVMAFSPVFLVTETIQKTFYYLAISSLLAIILAAFFALFLSRKISRPLVDMKQVAVRMAQGHYDSRIAISSEDEIGDLASTLNYLSSSLDDNIRALQNEKGKMESVVRSLSEGIIAVDQKGKIILVNPVVDDLLGLKGKVIEDQDIDMVPDGDSFAELFKKVLLTGESQSQSIVIKEKSLRLNLSVIKQENGDILGAVGIVQDITEWEKLEQLRREFVANVSHELRTPITVIRGYVDCLIEQIFNDKSPSYYYTVIKDETIRMERLIKDLMDLSLIQAGKIDIMMDELDIADVIKKTAEKLNNKAEENKVDLKVNLPESIIAYGDIARIEQLLIILIDNAIKFTPPEGTINITFTDEGERICVNIVDTGLGIPEEDMPYIFDRFYKVDKSHKRQKDSGTGLGLFIAKKIAELHGTEISVASKYGEGSRFSFCLNKTAKTI